MLMNGADLFVVPSLEDAYPLVTLEAMASGTPVLVSSNCGTAELISNDFDGLIFPAGDVDALASVIRKASQEREMLEEMGLKGRLNVESSNTWPQYSARVLQKVAERSVLLKARDIAVSHPT